ncbi:hypothetical protein Q8A67_000032 [Cirrhinus molitorella]|uniref:non-specific serine/threonine protein kinase n=1 Tax=Cirrhinus molitorella TaxID=172907 RepID=A0AA88Q4N2_9TELE|nr:hypothetical protein Q8A67_000032 [Cirrhinus molitorella]
MQKASIMYNVTNSPEKMESSRAQSSEQQNNPTEKHTEGRKGRACFRTMRKAVKRSFQTLKTKVCPCVPDREPSLENPQTSRQEPTAGTDPLESQPVFDYAQASQSSAVASAESSSDVFEDAFEYLPEETESSRAQPLSSAVVSAEKYPSSRPTDAPEQQNNPAENQIKGKKGHVCFRTMRKAVKRHFQTLKSKACPHVPDREPSHEDPQPSRRELTIGTDPLESQPVFDYAQAKQSSAVASAESSSDVFEDAFEYLPEETESSRAQASSSTVMSAEKYPSSFPTDAPEQQNNPTEKHKKGRKGHACLRTVWKAVKRSFQTLKTKVCPCVPDQEPSQENPQTPRQEPTARVDPLEYPPLRHGAEYFRSLYEVGEKLKLGEVIFYKGIRRSDGQQVLIKFIMKKYVFRMTLIADELFKPWCHEPIVMFTLQRPSSCDHIAQLYDWFIMEEHDVLIIEFPHSCVTLCEFIRQNRCHLNEKIGRRIMLQLTVALRHCLDRGVTLVTSVDKIVINPDTLQIKIVDFTGSGFPRESRYDSSSTEPALTAVKGLHRVLKELINGLLPLKKACLSKDCKDFLQKLQWTEEEYQNGRISVAESFKDIVDHAWFKEKSGWQQLSATLCSFFLGRLPSSPAS